MLFNIPAGYDRTFTNHVPSDVVLVAIANWSADAFDPGPLAAITRATHSVPEPSMLLLSLPPPWRAPRSGGAGPGPPQGLI
jgi:hypothetical protein